MQAHSVSTGLAAYSVSHDDTLPPGRPKSLKAMALPGALATVLALIVGCDNAVVEPELSFNGETVPDQTYVAGEQITPLTLPAAHGTGSLTYTLTPSVPGLRFAAASRTLDGSPTAADSYSMSYRAESAGAGDDAALNFTITVEESAAAASNRAPVVKDAITTLSAVVGESLSVDLAHYFADPDGDELTYAASSDTANVATATVQGSTLTVDGMAAGKALVLVIASDPDGASVHQAFTVIVTSELEVASILDARVGVSSHGYAVFHLNREGERLDDRPYALMLGDASASVHVISTTTRNQTLITTGASRLQVLDAPLVAAKSAGRIGQGQDMRHGGMEPIRDLAWVTDLNNNPPPHRTPGTAGQPDRTLQAQRPVSVGQREVFLDGPSWRYVRIPATARSVVTDGTRTLAIWVADAASGHVRTEMVNALAQRFLRPGHGNDIYDWVSATFGAPWGPHLSDALIPPSYNRQIHVLLFDIGGDGDRGSVLGFFTGKDLYLRSEIESSNERLMFYLDSRWLAHADGPTWEPTDRRPRMLIEAAVHEFQHLIYFYQKLVLRPNISTETWLNEMSSMIAEDLVSQKLGMHGPRGVPGNDPTAGAPGNGEGRLPFYNRYPDKQVTEWTGFDSYSITYALGSYLARTYGGAALFRAIVQSEATGVDAIEQALRALGHRVSFGDVLVNWAVAGLLSDGTNRAAPYRYNTGSWRTSYAGGLAYRLGSINLYHYRYCTWRECIDGPQHFTVEEFNALGAQELHSNRVAEMGINTGTVRLRMDADSGNRVTVVVKKAG